MKMPMIIVTLMVLAIGTHPIECMQALKKKQSDVAGEWSERIDSFGYAAEPNLNPTHPRMEDTYHVEQTAGYAFYGLYDGHGGDYVSNYAADNLHKNFDLKYNATKDVEESLKQAFLKTHNDLDEASSKRTGSTATVAVIRGNQLVVANAGDSRTVLYSAGKAIPLSVDHKPSNRDEFNRMLQLLKDPALAAMLNRMAVTRSLGDKASYPYPFIIPDAEIQSKVLTPEDDFLILASDGVWDVLTNEQACILVKTTLGMQAGNPNTPGDAAKAVVDAAIKRGTKDNVSALVVDLQKNRIKEHMKQLMQRPQEAPQQKGFWDYLYSFFGSK